PQSSAHAAGLVTPPTPATVSGITLTAAGSSTRRSSDLYNGTDSFTYQAKDASLLSNTVTVTLTINAVNDAPVGVVDSYSTNEDTLLTVSAANRVLKNDTDPENDALTAVLVTPPTHATVSGFTLNGDGSFSYTPAANYNGTDSFTYQAKDASLLSNTVTVTLTINPVNDAPKVTNPGTQ